MDFTQNKRKRWILILLTFILVIISLILFFRFQNLSPNNNEIQSDTIAHGITSPQVSSPTITATSLGDFKETTPTAIFQPAVVENPDAITDLDETSVLIFSMTDGIYQHLFVYHPGHFPLTRLTNNDWDDIHPAISRDGTKLAYSSKQNGYWDIYYLDLINYKQYQVTDSTQYDGAPTWSPDGKWLAFESYQNDNLEIFIQSTEDINSTPIQLTFNKVADLAPNWSPDGRKILFTSYRSGNEEIWLADLDAVDNRFVNKSQQADLMNNYANWHPDGITIMWSAIDDGYANLLTLDSEGNTHLLVPGNIGCWSPTGEQVASVFYDIKGTRLGIFDVETSVAVSPYVALTGRINGIAWGNTNLALLLPLLENSADQALENYWVMDKDVNEEIPENRIGLAKLPDIDAPYPYLLDTANESFEEFKNALIENLGWDYLATLQNAYMPITDPAPPEILENWLYTGRGIQINDAPMSTNWMATVREDINGKTYWRIYLRAFDQSGASGIPLHQRIWSFDLRTQGSPAAYEQGGNYSQTIPDGYWVDFTELAAQFGWERIASLLNWRTYYPGTQHTIYIFKESETLESALLDIFPPEALLPQTNNSVVPIIPTPTPEPEED